MDVAGAESAAHPEAAARIAAEATSVEMAALRELRGCCATLLPVRTVGVQGDGRTYGYVAALSCSGAPAWRALARVALLIPRVTRAVNRVVFVFGDPVAGPIRRIIPTRLSPDTLDQVRRLPAFQRGVQAPPYPNS